MALGDSAKTWRLAALLFAIFASALLSGCKGELYSNLSEDDANQMMAVLMANSIPTEKTQGAKSGFTISVDRNDMLRAIAVLKDAGYPKTQHESIATMFQPNGLMSSPFEERVRYIYALSQEVSQTLSKIDGVVSASVNIVLPEQPEFGQKVKPSSAAVFIKYRPGVDLDYFVPQIKRLVSSSIEGLDYSAVTVVLQEASPMRTSPIGVTPATAEVLPGLSVSSADQGRFWIWAFAAGFIILLLSLANLVILYLWRGKLGLLRKKKPSSLAAVEPS